MVPPTSATSRPGPERPCPKEWTAHARATTAAKTIDRILIFILVVTCGRPPWFRKDRRSGLGGGDGLLGDPGGVADGVGDSGAAQARAGEVEAGLARQLRLQLLHSRQVPDLHLRRARRPPID